MKKFLILLLGGLILSCEGPEPRRPVQGKTDTFIEKSVVRNRQLLASEEATIKQLIERDTLHEYFQSGSGSWFYYETQNPLDSLGIAPDDRVTFTYTLASLEEEPIYSQDEIGVLSVHVDKDELFPGLREALKVLRNREEATFLFPSAMGYGYPGDQNKIGTNVPLRCRITIINVEKSKDSIL
ncbi:MAG: gliding motility-associated peptidyl-prolyl isomerase GldI [Eudoraea sp.]|nr:gliding motility-associated peptidyl-prolyl isomerase GldI [Eudoraea sp.]